ncbi:hypothetical protein [Saccharopolyspora sp. NPDC050642]|uniref:hypothetical protein n=1 Tax=Saccharopolyspora sp. NPDC050642 TaxID=3157099 RepID=UPI0033EE7720
MSRYGLPARDEHASCEIAVGWDRQMGTFFAQVSDPGSDVPVLDRGDLFDRLTTPGQALALVRDYADVPPDIESTLLRDARADGHRTAA